MLLAEFTLAIGWI